MNGNGDFLQSILESDEHENKNLLNLNIMQEALLNMTVKLRQDLISCKSKVI